MTNRLAVWLPHFFMGALVLCSFSALQSILLHLPLAPAGLFIPFCLGGLGGLLIGNRNARIRELDQALQHADRRERNLSQESEERYHQLFELSPTVQLLIDSETGGIVKCNEAARNFYGYSTGELARKTLAELNVGPGNLEKNIGRVMAQEPRCLRFQHRLKSGEARVVDVYSVSVSLQKRSLMHAVIVDVTEGDEAETNMRRKTVEQRLLLDSIPVSVWYLRDPETFGMVNKAFADCFDLVPIDIAHKKLETVLRPENLALALASNRQVFAEKTALYYEEWFACGHGDPTYMAFTKTPKLDEAGNVEFVVCTATDITSLEQAKDMLQVERDLHVVLSTTTSFTETLRICLEKAIEVSQTDCGGLYLVDPSEDSLLLVTNQGFSEAFMQRASFYLGDSEFAQMVRCNQPIYSSYADSVLQAKGNFLQSEDGLRVIGIVPISFQGRVVACLTVASRRSEEISMPHRLGLERLGAHIGTFLVQKEQETLIRQHQHNLEALFETIQDFVFIFDAHGAIIYLNTAVSSCLGYQPAELIGKNVQTLHPDDFKEDILAIAADMLARNRDHCLIPLITREGKLIPVETHITQGQWSGQQAFFVVSRDISSRLHVERQRQLLVKNEGLERMAGAMAHHFNNLMTIVAGNLELAKDDISPHSATYALLDNAQGGCKRACELGQALLIYTGQFAETITSINISDFCEELLDSGRLMPPERIELSRDLASPGPVVAANPVHLEQTLTALMTNAAETIGKESGRIVFRVKTVDGKNIRNTHIFPAEWTPSQDRYCCLEITDTGDGIDERQMSKIFDPFYSDKFVGRGLGLPLALSIVKKFSGAIAVTSQLKRGSTFQVLLPEQVQEVQ